MDSSLDHSTHARQLTTITTLGDLMSSSVGACTQVDMHAQMDMHACVHIHAHTHFKNVRVLKRMQTVEEEESQPDKASL